VKISNTTYLIAFAKIGHLSLLQKMVGTIVIPTAVANEIAVYPQGQLGFIDLNQEKWINVQPVASEQQLDLLLLTLDPGEAEAIALALEQQAELLLIDELTGRKVAQSLNLNVSGSIGILIRAKQLGEIAAVKPFIDAMLQQGIL